MCDGADAKTYNLMLTLGYPDYSAFLEHRFNVDVILPSSPSSVTISTPPSDDFYDLSSPTKVIAGFPEFTVLPSDAIISYQATYTPSLPDPSLITFDPSSRSFSLLG